MRPVDSIRHARPFIVLLGHYKQSANGYGYSGPALGKLACPEDFLPPSSLLTRYKPMT